MRGSQASPTILLAFANDRDDRVRYLRNLPEETRCLRNTLSDVKSQGLCELVVRPNAIVKEILDVFQQAAYRNRVAVLHFGGHANSYQLLFETVEGQAAAADARAFARFLGQQTGLKLVFLNGCSTQAQVQCLLDAGVSAVIATSQAIDDGVATEFASRFYRGLAGGATIGTAFQEAEAAVQTTHGSTRDGDTNRDLYSVAAQDSFVADRLPWTLDLREGAEAAADWNLPEAAGDPLFGLPPLPELDVPDSPYRHLQWYRREDAAVFFGRGREIRDLYERVTAPRRAPILLFYGQSGVGKSSLLAAGLLPRLEDHYTIRYARRDQALGLLGTLKEALGEGRDASALASSWSEVEERESRPLLVVLDQVEERFTRPNASQSHELDDLLAALHGTFVDPHRRPRGKLILGFRKEWLAEIEKRMAVHELPHTKVFLERLEREGIEEVVTGPTRTARLRGQYGLSVEADLPRVIAYDLQADRGSPVAPTLQILLCKMWQRARARVYDRPIFDQALYREMLNEGLGLADFLEEQIEALHEEQPEVVGSGLALDLLAYHTTPLGTAEERFREELDTVYHHRREILSDLVQQCQDLYLLVDPAENQPDRSPGSRLAHDTLAPVVRQRFDESDRPGQRARRILENRAVEWQDNREGTPLDAQDLRLVEEGTPGMRAWTSAEERLVASSHAALRAQRRKQLARPLLAVLLVAIAVLAGWSIYRVWLRQQALSKSPQVEFEGGIFTVGTDDPRMNAFFHPKWQVSWPAFAIDKYEVSNGLYCLCNRAGVCSDHAYGGQSVCAAEIADAPVTDIPLQKASEYCRWLGRRVPVEIEWEWAARGIENRIYPTGNDPPVPGEVNIRPDVESKGKVWPVKEMRNDLTPEGVAGMVGNVSEWTISVSLSYTHQLYLTTWWPDLPEQAGGAVICRGGSFRDLILTQVSDRYPRSADEGADFLGFRCVEGPSREELLKEVTRLTQGE